MRVKTLPPCWPVFFGLGFFSLLAQAVLLRHFLACIAMSEMAIGVFFAFWLAWIGVGALAGRSLRLAQWAAEHLAWAALLYAPAALAQFAIIDHMRLWLKVPAAVVFPAAAMALAALCGTALVSFYTGFLFAAACRYLAALPLARTAVNAVYACEAVGSCAGGGLATLLPAAGASDETALFAGFALLLVIAIWDSTAERRRRALASALALGALLALAACCQRWQEANDMAQWTRALPLAQMRGAFRTPYGRYVWGVREGQSIVLGNGSEVEAMPDIEAASRTLALHLAQKPDCRHILIIGPRALALAARWREFSDVAITWLHPDPFYPAALGRAVPAMAKTLTLISCPAVEPRRFLATTDERFDLVILDVGEIATLSASRFATVEFFRLAQRVLKANGVLSWRITGGENYLGDELAWLGASALATLRQVFPHLALKAGAETWLFAAAQPVVSEDPEALLARYAALPQAEALYPAAALAALYNAERARFQRQRYEEAGAALPAALRVSDDQRPVSLLYSLGLAWRRHDLLRGDFLLTLWEKRWWLAIGLLLWYAICRRLALGSASDNCRAWGKADSCLLAAFAGLASMASAICLMFRLQTQCGSLFLLVGLLSSLFLLGVSAAVFWLERRLQKGAAADRILPLLAVCHIAFILLIAQLPAAANEVWHAGQFFLCGFLGGAYFPLASHWFAQSGESAQSAGGWLEACDHFGAAVGAFLSANLLLPLLGVSGCAIGIALAISAALAPYAAPAAINRRNRLARLRSAAAAALVAVVGLALLTAPWREKNLAASSAAAEAKHLAAQARRLCGNQEIIAAEATLPSGRRFVYWQTAEGPVRYVGLTESLAVEGVKIHLY
ncbi:MAG: hypothetical protein N3A66_02205, partial [Planctomycetota bacterium]|nr:hypothetical protein [Planctomycetota bacterium]